MYVYKLYRMFCVWNVILWKKFFPCWLVYGVEMFRSNRIQIKEQSNWRAKRACIYILYVYWPSWMSCIEVTTTRNEKQQQRTITHKHWSLIEFIKFFKSPWSIQNDDDIFPNWIDERAREKESINNPENKTSFVFYIYLIFGVLCVFSHHLFFSFCFIFFQFKNEYLRALVGCWCFGSFFLWIDFFLADQGKGQVRGKYMLYCVWNWFAHWRQLYLYNLLME